MNEALSHTLSALSGPTPEDVSVADALDTARTCPFFTLPSIMALRGHGAQMSDDDRNTLLRHIALNSPDPQHAFLLADIGLEELTRFYPTGRKEVSTFDAISKFLDTYGHSDPRETALLERLIFNPTPDYSSVLEREDAENPVNAPASVPADDSQDALINSFILKHRDDESSLLPREMPEPAPAPVEEPVAAEPHTIPSHATPPVADTSLSESLAKIYIRQKRYDKAFEIIHTLSLNNPKKSAYFADQLRFLRKLMLNRGMTQPGK